MLGACICSIDVSPLTCGHVRGSVGVETFVKEMCERKSIILQHTYAKPLRREGHSGRVPLDLRGNP